MILNEKTIAYIIKDIQLIPKQSTTSVYNEIRNILKKYSPHYPIEIYCFHKNLNNMLLNLLYKDEKLVSILYKDKTIYII